MIVIGDVHGNFDTLIALLDLIPEEQKAKGIAIAGDLIDRGPKSMQVVQYCIDNNIHVVKGNHEEMMSDWNFSGRRYSNQLWLGNGGFETLNSYKETVDHPYLKGDVDWDLFQKHCEYMDTLPYYLEFPDIKNDEDRYLVVSHSNVGNVWHLRNTGQAKDWDRFISDTTWGRPTKIKDVSSIYNIIGHTPQEWGPRIRRIYANVDTGCFWTKQGDGCGMLTALQFPEMIIYEHENIDSKVGHMPLKGKLTLEDLKARKKAHRIKY